MAKEERTYSIKCRRCGAISEVWYPEVEPHVFRGFVNQIANDPVEMECDCDKNSIMFHDVIGYKKPKEDQV